MPDATVYLLLQGGDYPPELWRIAGGEAERLLLLNSHLDGVALGQSQLVEYRAIDGRELRAAVLLPPVWRNVCGHGSMSTSDDDEAARVQAWGTNAAAEASVYGTQPPPVIRSGASTPEVIGVRLAELARVSAENTGTRHAAIRAETTGGLNYTQSSDTCFAQGIPVIHESSNQLEGKGS